MPATLSRSLRQALAALALMSWSACSKSPSHEPWQAIEIATDAEFTGMWFSDSRNGWITGGGYAIPGGIVGRTRDGGRTWRFQSGLTTFDRFALHRVQFTDSLQGCVVGDYGTVLLTEDGGRSWRRASRGLGGPTLFDVQFIDASNGWAIGSARLLRTEDGGETWRTLVRGTAENGYFSGNAVHFVDPLRGWVVQQHGDLLRSTDGGLHWTPVPLPHRAGERPSLRDVTFTDPLHGWVVGDAGAIFHTEDGGDTWVLQENGVPIVRVVPKGEPPRPRDILPELEIEPSRLSISAVHFLDAQHGCAVGSYADVAESVVIRTRDGGARWEVERVQPGEVLRSLFVLDAEHAWAAGDRARTQPQVVLRYTGGTR